MAIGAVSISIGTNNTKTTGTTLAYALTILQTINLNDRIIVMFAMDPAAGTPTCADSSSNTYSLIGSATNGSGTSGVRTFIFSAHCTHGNSSFMCC